MKRIAVFMLLAAFSLAGAIPAEAQRISPQENARQSRKASNKQQKKYNKAMKKQAKAQRKAYKRANKNTYRHHR